MRTAHCHNATMHAFATQTALAICLLLCAAAARPASAQVAPYPQSGPLLPAPSVTRDSQVPALETPQPSASERALPINLATALCLSQARPLVVAAAQASVEQAAAHLQGANALWLPDVSFGAGYSHHEGANQATEGQIEFDSFGSYNLGGGATLHLGVTDAIFQPLAAQQFLCARQFDLQTAHNDALLSVAQTYFEVQEARGRLAGILDSTARAEELVNQVESLAKSLVPEMEVDRARALLAELNQQSAAAQTNWRIASARLNRVLRLNPGAVVAPQEPTYLQVTLISSAYSVDDLIPCGLVNRPELASQKAVVQATLELLRQEKIRPLLPSVVLEGIGPNSSIQGGVFGGGQDGNLSTSGGRSDVNFGLVWTLKNMGAGNRALVRGRAADNEKAVIELFNVQDRVAEEIVAAHAAVDGARREVPEAETAVREASVTFGGTLQGLKQVRGAGNLLQTVSRPQEAVAALQQLNLAYQRYFTAVNKYNQAEFQLYHAIGYPSRILAWERPTGEIQAIDTSRPAELTPAAQNAGRAQTSRNR
jgi:outer membrane protein TolC